MRHWYDFIKSIIEMDTVIRKEDILVNRMINPYFNGFRALQQSWVLILPKTMLIIVSYKKISTE